MEDETLNIQYHIKIMVLKALNRSRFQSEAAGLLGVSERTLHRYKKDFGIVYDKAKDVFYFKGEKAILIRQT